MFAIGLRDLVRQPFDLGSRPNAARVVVHVLAQAFDETYAQLRMRLYDVQLEARM